MAPETSNPPLQKVGNYELLSKVAEGGMGSIYRGRNCQTGEIVAIKIMPAHMANNPVLLRRFKQEFDAASKLDHPNIVRALDYGEENGMPYLVMEFVEGESLGAKIERDGRMPVNEAIRLIVQVAQGLHRAHKMGMIHRDVKPDNILVTPKGVAKLADLGLVKEVDADLNLTKTGRGLGTPHFMAPEQFRNAKNADVRCDVYSLAATLYNMVTGELPFRSNGPLDAWMKKINNELVDPRTLVPDLPERTHWAIMRAMNSAPEQRPGSCREFVEDLTGQSTRRLPSTDSSAPINEIWYLVYKDEYDSPHTVKGTTSAIRRSLKDGLLGDASNVRAARTKAGPFEQLRNFPEFRDLALASTPPPLMPSPRPPSRETTPPGRAPTIPQGSRPSGSLPPGTPGRGSQVVETVAVPPVAPLIDMGAPPEGQSEPLPEWIKWVFLILIAIGSAGLAFLLLPLLQ